MDYAPLLHALVPLTLVWLHCRHRDRQAALDRQFLVAVIQNQQAYALDMAELLQEGAIELAFDDPEVPETDAARPDLPDGDEDE